MRESRPIPTTTRRDLLKSSAIAAGAAVVTRFLGGCAGANGTAPPRSAVGSIRVAHLTDIHVQPEKSAGRGMAAALRHVQSQKNKPAFILNTGDCVYETLRADRARTQTQWDLWKSVLRDENSLPVEHCLGNHDVWGWDKERSGTTGAERGWGKRWAMDELGLAKPYHAFDRGAWRFVMLDSVQPLAAEVWHAKLDEEQFAWLESELKATTKPVMVASHVPIVSPATLLDTGRIGGTPDAPALAPRRVHIDVKRIGQLFAKFPNVKLCVSGHLHQIDRVDYRGVTYMTNPAVCGSWWAGNHLGVFGEMYTLYDLHPDGTFDVTHVDYGWTPDVPPATQPVAH